MRQVDAVRNKTQGVAALAGSCGFSKQGGPEGGSDAKALVDACRHIGRQTIRDSRITGRAEHRRTRGQSARCVDVGGQVVKRQGWVCALQHIAAWLLIDVVVVKQRLHSKASVSRLPKRADPEVFAVVLVTLFAPCQGLGVAVEVVAIGRDPDGQLVLHERHIEDRRELVQAERSDTGVERPFKPVQLGRVRCHDDSAGRVGAPKKGALRPVQHLHRPDIVERRGGFRRTSRDLGEVDRRAAGQAAHGEAAGQAPEDGGHLDGRRVELDFGGVDDGLLAQGIRADRCDRDRDILDVLLDPAGGDQNLLQFIAGLRCGLSARRLGLGLGRAGQDAKRGSAEQDQQLRVRLSAVLVNTIGYHSGFSPRSAILLLNCVSVSV